VSKRRSKAKRIPLVKGETQGVEPMAADDRGGGPPAIVHVASRSRRLDWVFIVAVLGSVGTIIGAALAYQSYRLSSQQPDLAMHVYRVSDNTEYWYDSIRIEPGQVVDRANMVEFELPLKIINHSDVDALDITVWLAADDKDVQLVVPAGFARHETFGSQEWTVIDSKALSPQSAAKYHGIMLRAPKGRGSANLLWKIFAMRMLPKRGTLKVSFW